MDQFKAAKTGDLQQLRVALTVNNVNDDDGYDLTALHYAADCGYVDCVKLCIEMGANVNARSNAGSTPFHLASYQGHANVVRVLLDTGAIIDAADNEGFTALYDAISKNHVDAARHLIDRGAKVSNVQLDEDIPAIPDWVTKFIESRAYCRCVAITIIGVHKYHRTSVTENSDINVLRLISKHIWSTRMDYVWGNPSN
jgi:ankyrin repeat protein